MRNSKWFLSSAVLTLALGAQQASAATCVAGGSPCARQVRELTIGDDNEAKHALAFEQPLLANSTVLVFTTDMNLNGDPVGSGAPPLVSVRDSANGAYRELLTVNDPIDWQAAKVFARTAASSGALAVEVTWITNQWHGVVILEVANVTARPVLGVVGKFNPSASTTKDGVSSGALELGSTPALLIGLGANFRDAKGDVGAPYPGSGFTALSSAWNWKGKEGTSLNPSALVESAYFANPGRVAATFTASPNDGFNDNLVAIGVAFQTASGGAATPVPASPSWTLALLTLALLVLGGSTARNAARLRASVR